MKHKLSTRPLAGFTLIELLVVIAIIAILAAILFPVFAQAKLAAKKIVNVSNMKQISLSLLMYSNDYDDECPQASYEFKGLALGNPINPTGRYQIHWTYLMQPYIKNYSILIAPGDPTPDLPVFPCPNGTADFGKLDSSGQMYCDWQYPNSYLLDYNVVPAHDWLPVPLTIFPEPATQIAMTDRRYKSTDPNNPTIFSGKKGVSGFNPSQPCTQEGATYDPTLVAQGANEQPQSSLATYGFWNPQAVINLNATLTGGNDDPDLARVWYDQYTNQANYGFADGHAKTESFGATLAPVMGSYQYGDTFYPRINPQEGVSCMQGG